MKIERPNPLAVIFDELVFGKPKPDMRQHFRPANNRHAIFLGHEEINDAALDLYIDPEGGAMVYGIFSNGKTTSGARDPGHSQWARRCFELARERGIIG